MRFIARGWVNVIILTPIFATLGLFHRKKDKPDQWNLLLFILVK
jgi:hypothetical protein